MEKNHIWCIELRVLPVCTLTMVNIHNTLGQESALQHGPVLNHPLVAVQCTQI